MANSKISALTAATTPLAGTEVLPIVQSGVTKQVSVANLTAGRSIAVNDVVASGELVSTTNNARISLYRSTGTCYFDWASGQTLAFGTETSQGGAGRVNKVNFTDAGNIEIANGNLVPSTAAKGINFTANTAAAGMTSQLLNWYEEGTWTPVYTPASGAFGTIGASNTGRYRRVGKTVFFWADIRTTGTPNLGTASGQLYITGLPFTSSADGGYGQVSIMQKWNLGTAFTNIGVVVDVSNTRLYFTKNSSNTGVTYIQATELSTATDNFGNLMGIFGMYTV